MQGTVSEWTGTDAVPPSGTRAEDPGREDPAPAAPPAGDDRAGGLRTKARRYPPTVLLPRTLLLALTWWAVSEGQTAALWAGVLALPAALVLSLRLAPPCRWKLRPWPTLRFFAYFLGASMIAGIDVGRRVLHPRLPIKPDLIRVTLRLPHGAPRLLLVAVIGLMPGSVCVVMDADSVLLHQLNTDQDMLSQVRDLERRIAAVFGLSTQTWAEPDARDHG